MLLPGHRVDAPEPVPVIPSAAPTEIDLDPVDSPQDDSLSRVSTLPLSPGVMDALAVGASNHLESLSAKYFCIVRDMSV